MEERPFNALLEESETSQESSSRTVEPCEGCLFRPLQLDASWLPVYKEEQGTIELIVAFVSSPEKEESQKLRFLKGICRLCRTARDCSLSQGLDVFCHKYKLAENIKVLLEEEPRDQLCTEVRMQAMLAIAELSNVKTVLEGKEESLLHACFWSLFWLPPKAAAQHVGKHYLFHKTFRAMDTMLETVVLNLPGYSFTKHLQNIFQMLLNFTNSGRAAVQERALWSIGTLCILLSANPTLKAWFHIKMECYKRVSYGEVQIPILGQLLGRLTLFCLCKMNSWFIAYNAILHLLKFMRKQRSRLRLKKNAQRLSWQDEKSCFLCVTINRHMGFGKYLWPSERTDVVLEAIEALRDSSIFRKEAANIMLEEATKDPEFWLFDVPKIMSSIQGNMEFINTEPALQSLQTILHLLADYHPMPVVTALLEHSPSAERTRLTAWDMMLSKPQSLHKIFKELLSRLRDTPVRSPSSLAAEAAPMPCLAFLEFSKFQSESQAESSRTEVLKEMVSVLLGDLLVLSARPALARKMQVLLPISLEVLQDSSTEVKEKVLLVFRNVMAQLQRQEASAIAMEVVEKFPPFFDHEKSLVRELSMVLFRDLVKAVVWFDKRKMKKKVQSHLLPLFFHMRDQSDTVAKVSMEALLAAAKLLRWKKLQHVVWSQQLWRIGMCLLVPNWSRPEECIDQSLHYLKDAQAPLRELAVWFIGLAATYLENRSHQKMAVICTILKPLEHDSEFKVRRMTTRIINILNQPLAT